jgi:hypothetical protein
MELQSSVGAVLLALFIVWAWSKISNRLPKLDLSPAGRSIENRLARMIELGDENLLSKVLDVFEENGYKLHQGPGWMMTYEMLCDYSAWFMQIAITAKEADWGVGKSPNHPDEIMIYGKYGKAIVFDFKKMTGTSNIPGHEVFSNLQQIDEFLTAQKKQRQEKQQTQQQSQQQKQNGGNNNRRNNNKSGN